MAGSEFFTVGLKDKVTGPSVKMGRAAEKLERQLSRLERRRQVKARLDLGAERITRAKQRVAGGGRMGSRGSARAIGGGFSGLSTEVKVLGAAAVATAIALTAKLGKSILDTANLAGQSKLAFSAMLGSDKAGDAQIDKNIQLSNKYGISIADTTESIQQFMALGFKAPQAEAMHGLVADMRFLGASQEKMKRVALALSQIQAAGKLEGDEIRQLGEAGLPIGKLYERIGAGMGLTATATSTVVDQVKKLKEAGKIPANHALNSIAEVLLMTVGKTKLGDAGAEAAQKTVGGTTDRIGVMFETGMFQAIRKTEPELVKGLNAVFNGLAGTDGAQMASTFESILFKVADILKIIGPILPDISKNFIEAFGSVSGLETKSFADLARALPGVATNLGTIAGHIARIVGHLGGETISKLASQPLWKTMFPGIVSVVEGVSKTGNFLGSSGSMAQAEAKAALRANPTLGKDIPISEMGVSSPELWKMFGADGLPLNDNAGSALPWNMLDGVTGQAGSSSSNYSAITSAAAENIHSSRGGSKSNVTVTIPITIDGAGNPEAVAKKTFSVFEDEAGAYFDRLMQGSGA